MIRMLWHGQQSMIGDGLLLLSTLIIIVLGNYLALPKGGPLRYWLLDCALTMAILFTVGLAIMMLLHIF